MRRPLISASATVRRSRSRNLPALAATTSRRTHESQRTHSRSRNLPALVATTLCIAMALPLALPGNTAAQNPSAAGGSGAGVPSSAGGSGVEELSAAGESGAEEPTVAQGDEVTDLGEGTERRLVERQSSERVDGVVIALFSIAGVMSVMLAVFLWHTSPRRRLRLARARSQARDPGNGDEGVV